MATVAMQWPDYVILAAFLGISLGIGVYHSLTGGKQRTTQEFIMANRKLGIIPTALSLFVSFKSAIMILGLTSEMYTFGIQYMIWGCVASAVSILIAERLFVPWLYPLKLVSINDVSKR
jgi:Na+/proline symporter